MNTYSKSFLSGIFILLCSLFILNSTATACPLDFSSNDGSWSFNTAMGSSQSKTVTVQGLPGTVVYISIASDAFTVDRSPITITDGHPWPTFTITFHPGENTTGTVKAVLTVSCSMCTRTASIEGTVPVSGVANSGVPSDVSFTVTPNPATDNVNILTSGARTAEIGIYDLLGKEIASRKTTNWKWNAASIAPGSYFVRIAGESNTGEPFLISRKIIISR